MQPGAHNNLAAVLAQAGHLEKAVEAYDAAIDLAPTAAAIRYNKAVALSALGLARGAIAAFDETLALDPTYRDADQRLAAILARIDASTYLPDIDTALTRCFASSRIDYVAIARPAARQLMLKYELEHWDDLIATLDSDALLISLLRLTVNTDYRLERFLTALRRHLLLKQPRDVIPLRLTAALACQCCINEYVFAEIQTERDEHIALRAEITQAGADAPPSALLLYALYAPLYTLPHAAKLAETPEETWPSPLREVFQRTLLDPLEEWTLKSELESLSAPRDPVSMAVRDQYEANPYPRWVHIPHQTPCTAGDYLRQRFPDFDPPEFLDQPINVLIAGCGTGQHPIIAAATYQNAAITAIDLSFSSLAYAQRMTKRLDIETIGYIQADILDLDHLETQFDLIESVGVLHHMHDPAAGWSVLSRLLKPSGVFHVGLYSEGARRVIVEARDEIAALGIAPTPAGISEFRQSVLDAGEDGPFARLLDTYDFFTTSSCRDLIFHVQEHRFTLPQIKRLIDENEMRFIGFDFDDRSIAESFRAQFGEDEFANLDSWRRFEDCNPDAIEGYVFWCQKLR